MDCPLQKRITERPIETKCLLLSLNITSSSTNLNTTIFLNLEKNL